MLPNKTENEHRKYNFADLKAGVVKACPCCLESVGGWFRRQYSAFHAWQKMISVQGFRQRARGILLCFACSMKGVFMPFVGIFRACDSANAVLDMSYSR